MRINRREIHIEWGDCDPAGIVYFPRYFEYFDACTNALFESAGLRKPEMLKNYGIVGIPLVETRARYVVPSSFGDTVIVETCVIEWKKSSFKIQHKLYVGGVLAVEAEEVRVWTVRTGSGWKNIKSKPIPREVIARFTDS